MSAGRILGLAALYTLCGCSLLLDTTEYREVAEPGDVSIESHEPPTVLEGAMSPVILRGQGFSKSATVTAVVVLPDGTEQSVTVPDPLVSGDRAELALLLDVPVLPGHGPKDDAASVRITVSQGSSGASAEVALPLEALPELTLAGEHATMPGPPQIYSEIVIDDVVTVTGDEPLRLVATHAIRIDQLLEASGQDATAELPGAGGPAGCDGGAGGVPAVNEEDGQNGGCELGGGRGGAGVTGVGPGFPGGGGGCAPDPANSADEAHGQDTCTPELVPVGDVNNRGHGGGGGGSYETVDGGHGGGGGGAIELSAPVVSFGPGGALDASGGAGAPGVVIDCGQDRHSGAGGGGAGGVVLLRADTLLFRQEDIISVDGGAGGVACETKGGRGSDGQVRIDVASARLGDGVTGPEAIVAFFSRNVWRGPRLAETTPRLVTSGMVPITVRGDPTVAYDLQVDSGPQIEIHGNQTEELLLERGLRVVCVAPRVEVLNSPESNHCLTIAVLAP